MFTAVNVMRNIIVHFAVLLDILYSVTAAEFGVRNVVPVQHLYNPVNLKNKIEPSRPEFKQDVSKLHYRHDYAEIFNPISSQNFDFEFPTFTTLDPKLSPQLVDWINMYDLGQNSPLPLTGERDKISSSTLFPGGTPKEPDTTTTTEPTTTTTESNTDDAIALKCVKWAKCQAKLWTARQPDLRYGITPLPKVKRTS